MHIVVTFRDQMLSRYAARLEALAGGARRGVLAQALNEGGGGVTAHPWNRSAYYDRAFITSGLPGCRRASPKLGGHVYRNVAGGRWGGPIAQVHSGLFIPTEMTKGQTAAAFDKGAAGVLATTVVSRLGAMLP